MESDLNIAFKEWYERYLKSRDENYLDEGSISGFVDYDSTPFIDYDGSVFIDYNI